jgi:aspartokinase
VETIAVYWEPRVKTYGFNEVTDLSLLEISIKPEQMADLGFGVQELGDLGIKLFLVLAQKLDVEDLGLYLLIKYEWEERIVTRLRQIIGGEPRESIHVTSPVGLIYFQGPHFGDRYGIADSAFRTLSRRAIPILAAGCSASSIYLVLPAERIKQGRTLLAKAFELP